ncbi:MAG TPA: hypothetical protein VMZ26_08220, partial [Pyrinomonadaceae bacterium]|nr:hypothetical protein [Pyrinomonadaceae bacterium]
MSNLIKPLIAALVLAVMVSTGFVIYTLPHWWNKLGTAAGTSRDGVIQVFSVYKSRSGEYLFVGDQANEAYIFYPLGKLVGMPGAGASQFVFVPYFA